MEAVNLPEHGDNPVHTDVGARAAGYDRALVAGTTVYAYLTHPVAAAWGERWVLGGSAEVRLRAPVFDRDHVEVAPGDDANTVEARVGGDVRAMLAVALTAEEPERRAGAELPSIEVPLDHQRVSYARRAGDSLDLYDRLGTVHPVLWPTVANHVFTRFLVDGPWVHTRSRVVHQGPAAPGAVLEVASTVVEVFQSRAGERAIVDVRMAVAGSPVAYVEHEAIIRLA